MADSLQVTKINHFHEELISYMITRPTATNSELAMAFKRTPTHMSIIKNSDAFKARLRERQDQLFDEAVIGTTKDRLEALATESLERLIEKIATSDNDDFILAAATMATKSLGFGNPKSSNAPTVQLNFMANPADLAAGRALIHQPQEALPNDL
jgi:hypothetical protein